MSVIMRWGRNRGGLFAALLVVALMFTPVLDAFICRGEVEAGPANVAVLISDDGGPDKGGAHGADSEVHCLHGHCHHAAAYVPSVTEAGAVLRVSVARRHLAQDIVHTSSLQFALKRPPRA